MSKPLQPHSKLRLHRLDRSRRIRWAFRWQGPSPGLTQRGLELKDSSNFGAELGRIAAQLRVHGISINFDEQREGDTAGVRVENGKTGGSQAGVTDPSIQLRFCCNHRLFNCNTVSSCGNRIYGIMLKCSEYSAATP